MESIVNQGEQKQSPGARCDGIHPENTTSTLQERLKNDKHIYRKPVEQPREVLAQAARRREARKPKVQAKDEGNGSEPIGRKRHSVSRQPVRAEAAPEGECHHNWLPCLRCMGQNLRCSFVHNRSAGSNHVCTGCERMGETFCIQVATDRAGRYYGVDQVTSVQVWPAEWRSADGDRKPENLGVFVPIPNLRDSPAEYEAFVQTAEYLINGEPIPSVVDRLSDGLKLTDTENWVLPLWWVVEKPEKKVTPGTESIQEEPPAWQGYFQQLRRQREARRAEENEAKVAEYRAEIQDRRRRRENQQTPASDEGVTEVGEQSVEKEKGQIKQKSNKKEEKEEKENGKVKKEQEEDPLAYTSSGRILQYLCRERKRLDTHAEAFKMGKQREKTEMANSERIAKMGLLQIDYTSSHAGVIDSSSDSEEESKTVDSTA